MSILSAVIGSIVSGGGWTPGLTSPWSNQAVIGDAVAGGYYAGRIVDGGVTYALIIAPKATGSNGGIGLAYKTTGTAAPIECQTLTNGPAATAAMAALGSTYPAASYCAGLVIDGYDDWYLPARDELEILYRAFKPNGTLNRTEPRSTGIYGGDGLKIGTNVNSSPVGAGYTTNIPAQTTVPIFTTTAESLLIVSANWSSTESTATNAWRQNSSNGHQYSDVKTNSYYVRAVRRVAV